MKINFVNKSPFSLLELMIVLGLLLFIMSISMPAVGPMITRSNVNGNASHVKNFLNIGYSVAITSGDVSRVVLGYDPIGFKSRDDLVNLTGKPANDAAKVIDINNDGIAHWYQSDNFKWFMFFLVKDGLGNGQLSLNSHVQDVDYFGPFWLRRPVLHKSTSGFEQMNFKAEKAEFIDPSGNTFYYRALVNKGSTFTSGPSGRIVAPINIDPISGELESMMLSGADSTIDTSIESASAVGAFWNFYEDSARMFDARNTGRLHLNWGQIFENNFITVKGTAADMVPNRDLSFVTQADAGKHLLDDDNEDGSVDEGMWILAQKYNPTNTSMPITLPMDGANPTKNNSYNYYFSAMEDHDRTLSKKLKIAEPEYSSELVRRVWVIPEGESKYELIWRFDKMVNMSGSPTLGGLKNVMPYFLGFIFDAKERGVFVQSSFGSARVARILIQVSDMTGDHSIMVMYMIGKTWAGTLDQLSVTEADLDEYYKGVID